MKKVFLIFWIFFILSISFANADSIFDYAELKTTATATIFRDDSKKENAISGAFGGRIAFKNADFRAFSTIPKTAFGDICADSFGKARFGAGVFLFQKSLPISLKAGNLLFSRSVSRLKSPAPSSSANTLSVSPSFSAGLGANLPTLLSAEKPLSLSVSSDFPFAKIEFAADENSSVFAGVSSKKSFSKHSKIEFALTFSREFTENKTQVLKKSKSVVDGAFRAALLGEVFLKTPIFQTEIKTGVHESAFGGEDIWIFSQAWAFLGWTSFGASYFSIPTRESAPKTVPLLGQNSSVVRTFEQIGANAQIALPLGKNSVRLGTHFSRSQKIVATKDAQEIGIGKIRGAIEFSRGDFSIRADFTRANALLFGNPPNKSTTPEEYFDYAVSFSLKPKDFSIFAKTNLKIQPPYSEKYEEIRTFNANLSISPVKNRNLYLQSGFSSSFKGESLNSRSISGAVSFKTSGKIRVSSKIAVEMKF